MKKLILVAAIAAATSSAFAMEAMDESTLSETTGQAGLTIVQDSLDLDIAELRYTDSTGAFEAASSTYASVAAAGNAYGTDNNAGTPADTGSRGTLYVKNLAIGATQLSMDIDIGTNSAGDTGLLLRQRITGLTVSIGTIGLDGNDHMTRNVAAGAKDLGGISLSGIDLGAHDAAAGAGGDADSAMLITPGGSGGNSGITIKSLIPQDIALTLTYTDNDAAQTISTSVGIEKLVDGAKSIDVEAGGIKITNTGLGATGVAAAGLVAGDVASGVVLNNVSTYIKSIDLGGATGIQVASTNIGSVGVHGLTLGSGSMTVRGH